MELEEIKEDRVEEKIEEFIKDKKYTDLKALLKGMKSADISAILDDLDKEEAVIVFRLLSKEKAGMAFSYMETDMREKLIQNLTETELKNVLDELFMDDTVDLIEEMPSNVVTRILRTVNRNDRKIINELLKYPDDSAGSVMTTEFLYLRENMTIEQALDRIRKVGTDSETIYTCYVIDKDRTLKGIISIKEILLAKEETLLIRDLMETNIISVNTLEDQEEVAKLFDKYDLYALPVVDNENRLVGIITVDDAMDVLQEEVDEDFNKMAAISPTEDGYFETSVFKHAKSRIVWLLVLMLSSAITGTIITNYESAFSTVPLLVAFIPMIMDTGGNCGSQSSTLVIRGLATDELEVKDVFKILWKEIRIAVIVGIILSLVNGLRIFVQYNSLQLATTIGLSITTTVIMAKSIGCLLPLIAKKLKLDPAIMAAPLITTIVDVLSILLYFQIATLIIGL